MRRAHQVIALIGLAVSANASTQLVAPAAAQNASAQAAYQDIEQTFGFVPDFFRKVPEAAIAGAWMEMKSLQLNPKTKLDGKTKELIGLAVSAQVPCHYCVYFHTQAAKASGATDEEIKEAVAMAGITRHWSTVLNGMDIDLAAFKRDTDAALKAAGERTGSTTGMRTR